MTVMIRTRPDGRRYISLKSVEPGDYLATLDDATLAHSGSLYTHIDLADSDLVSACLASGFVTSVITNRYMVPFAAASAPIVPPARSACYHIAAADSVDPEALFRLDEQLRQDVPGTDGWVGRRTWFDDELASDEFDATGYQVAIETHSGRLIGLIRFWRNPTVPRLGLLAVVPQYRNGYLGHALLHAGLAGASQWGSPVFETDTARPSLQRRLDRLAAVRTGSFAQMVCEQ